MPTIYGPATLVYADTSVFGGVFDSQFARASTAFFDLVHSGRFQLAISPALEQEIRQAPLTIQQLYDGLTESALLVNSSRQIEALMDSYLAHHILTPRWETDALHVASATVGKCSIIVSWNFKHIVHFQKIRLYNAVNVLLGYDEIAIHSPAEVIEHG